MISAKRQLGLKKITPQRARIEVQLILAQGQNPGAVRNGNSMYRQRVETSKQVEKR